MYRCFALMLIVCFACFALAQNPVASLNSSQPSPSSSSPVQVVYVIENSTLYIYNIDPQTLQATQVGTFTTPASTYPGLLPSPNGKILYYTNDSQQGLQIYVYLTNASGVPNNTPEQTLTVQGLNELLIDPKGNFVYAEFEGPQGADTTPYAIERYEMDPSTGKLSNPVVEAKYQLDSSEGGNFCSLNLMSVNPTGTELYDAILCSQPFTLSATYNERAINASTGALGPDVQIYGWSNDSGGAEKIQFVKNLMFDFDTPDNYGQPDELVNIYPIQPNVATPVISCGTDQYAPCGDFITGTVHPSAEYVFLTDPTSTTYIGQVNVSSRQIVPDSNSIPYEVQALSPDGTIAYGANDVNGALDIEIFGFDAATGGVTQGGTISVPSDLDSWWAAERY
jgi:hypothetical protein